MTTTPDQLSKFCPDGTILGQSASDKVSFYGATPVVQLAAGSGKQVAAGTTASTTSSPAGYTTTTQATNIAVLVDQMRTIMVNMGLMVGT